MLYNCEENRGRWVGVYVQKQGLATLGDKVKKQDLSCPFVYEEGRVNPHGQSVLRAFRHW